MFFVCLFVSPPIKLFLFDRQLLREREQRHLPPAALLPRLLQRSIWAQAKLGARRSFWILGHSLLFPQGALAWTWIRSEEAGPKPRPIWNFGTRWKLSLLWHTPSPHRLCFMSQPNSLEKYLEYGWHTDEFHFFTYFFSLVSQVYLL